VADVHYRHTGIMKSDPCNMSKIDFAGRVLLLRELPVNQCVVNRRR
jgi:hypothetical protein